MNKIKTISAVTVMLTASVALGPGASVASAQSRYDPYYNQSYYSQNGYYSNNPYYNGRYQQPYYSTGRYRSSSDWNDDYRYYRRNKRSTGKSVAIIGGSAAGGALIGGLAGGGKGAAIGALIGGVGGLIYDQTTRNKDHR